MTDDAGAVATFVIVILMVFNLIAQWRFYRAYLDRYGDAESSHRHWLWGLPMTLRDVVQRRPPYSLSTLFRALDDPVVERRRLELLLSWGSVVAFILLGPFVVALSGAYRR
jgi:hypothetical protein